MIEISAHQNSPGEYLRSMPVKIFSNILFQTFEVEDTTDELTERSLLVSSGDQYNIHDLQLTYLKEKASYDKKIFKYHNLLVDRLVCFRYFLVILLDVCILVNWNEQEPIRTRMWSLVV